MRASLALAALASAARAAGEGTLNAQRYFMTDAPPSPAAAFWASFAATASLPALPAHTPSFAVTVETLSLVGAAGPYALPVHVIRDNSAAAGGVVVATWTERTSFLAQQNATGAGLGELNLLAPLPALAPAALPPLARYGWAWLWGAKVTTVTWLDCCGVTGDSAGFSLAAAPDAAALYGDRESATCSAPANAAAIFIGVEGAGVADAEAVPDTEAVMDAERVVVPLLLPLLLLTSTDAEALRDGETTPDAWGDALALDDTEPDAEADALSLATTPADADGDGDTVIVADADTFAAV